jgi:hypothetical protein
VVAVSADALPRVEGRHRNRALAAARRARAIELRTGGFTYDQIAEELGYANRGTVFRIVRDALMERQDEAVGSLRFLESYSIRGNHDGSRARLVVPVAMPTIYAGKGCRRRHTIHCR